MIYNLCLNIFFRFTDNILGDAVRKFKKYATFFAIGGSGYGLIEIIWRGYTHWTMVIAGGICFVFFSIIAEKYRRKPLLYKALLCSASITLVELVFGVVFNMIFKMGVWDYSNMPLNLFGQICPLFSLLWGALGFAFIPFANIINKGFQK